MKKALILLAVLFVLWLSTTLALADVPKYQYFPLEKVYHHLEADYRSCENMVKDKDYQPVTERAMIIFRSVPCTICMADGWSPLVEDIPPIEEKDNHEHVCDPNEIIERLLNEHDIKGDKGDKATKVTKVTKVNCLKMPTSYHHTARLNLERTSKSKTQRQGDTC